MGHLQKKLDIVSHIPENISHMRGIEWFYEEVFLWVFWDDIERDSQKWMEVKNKMQMFSVAYELAKSDAPENFEWLQWKLEKRILALKCKWNLSDWEKIKEFEDTISILLEEIYTRFEKCWKLWMLQNIIWGYVDKIGKYSEGEFDGCIIENRIKIKGDASEILAWDWYKIASDKSNYLLEHGLSYKRGIEVYYEKVKEKCFTEQDKKNNPDWIAEKMQMFNLAYTISKYKFQFVTRKSWERYFEHLLSVVDLYLEYEEKPTFEWVMVALLHDIIEDSDIDEETLRYLFWSEIAMSVCGLSKSSVYEHIRDDKQGRKDKEKLEKWRDQWILNADFQTSDDIKRRKVTDYISEEEMIILEEYNDINKRYKFDRNWKYFNHFLEKGLCKNNEGKNVEDKEKKKKKDKEEIEIDKRDTRIKIYDRIHNTITLPWFGIGNINKIFRKIDETINYFLPITSKLYPELNTRLIKELEVVLKWLISRMQNLPKKMRKYYREDIQSYSSQISKFKTSNKQVEEIIEK